MSFSSDERVQELVAKALDTKSDRVGAVLKSIGRVRDWQEIWNEPIRGLLANATPEIKMATLQAIGSSGAKQFNTDLREFARNNNDQLAAAAWRSLAETGANLPDDGIGTLMQTTLEAESPLDRLAAAQALSRANIGRDQLRKFVIAALPRAAENEQAILIGKVRSLIGKDPELNQRLEEVANRFQAESTAGSDEAAQEKLKEVLSSLVPGDAKHGESVFYSKRAACSACHTVKGKGGDTGPDLSSIGSIRRRPDLLEAIMYPSSTIVNSYETYTAVLANGRTAEGIIQRADSRWLVLRNSQRQDTTIAREDIEELQRSALSVMPNGLHANLNLDELSDLLAYLESLKPDTDQK